MSQHNAQGETGQPDYFAVQSLGMNNQTAPTDFHLRYDSAHKSQDENAPAENTAGQGRAGVEARADQYPGLQDQNDDDKEGTPEGDPEPEDTIFADGPG